jgi:hypothetical protein
MLNGAKGFKAHVTTRGDVVKVLGEPTIITTDPSKEPWRSLGWKTQMTYYITIYEKGLANDQYDEWISLYFDADDHLVDVKIKAKDAR